MQLRHGLIKKYIELKGYETSDKNELNAMLVGIYQRINDSIKLQLKYSLQGIKTKFDHLFDQVMLH